MFFKKTEKQKIVDMFSPFVSKSAIEEILNGDGTGDSNSIEELRQIHFVLLRIRDDDLGLLVDLVNRITSIVQHKGGYIASALPSGFLITFGYPFAADDEKAQESKEKTLKVLRAECAEHIKVVEGQAMGIFKNIGTSNRMIFGPLIPSFSILTSKLEGISFGGVESFNL